MHRLWLSVITVTVIAAASSAYGQQLRIVDNIPGVFSDISNGTPLEIGDDGEVTTKTSPGNLVFPAGGAVVANNGGVGFGVLPDTNLAPDNETIPSLAAFGGGQAVLIYWDDLDDKDGDVFVSQDTGDLIVQWHNRPLGGGSTGTARFQLKVFSAVGPSGIVAQLIFDDVEQPSVDGGAGATIGYQDGGAGFEDIQWSFNRAGAVTNGMVLSFVVSEQVPSASAWGMVVMGIVLMMVGTILARRPVPMKRRVLGG